VRNTLGVIVFPSHAIFFDRIYKMKMIALLT